MSNFPSHWPAEFVEKIQYWRFLTADDLSFLSKGVCRWCQKPLKGVARRWCSATCRYEFEIRSNSTVVSNAVFERDHGVCAVCGIDTDEISRLRKSIRYQYDHTQYYLSVRQWGPWHTANYRYWEADHIIPVIDRGGCCGLDNYQTLCLTCHKADTAALAKCIGLRRRVYT